MDVAGHGRRLLSALEVQRHRGELCDCVLVAEGQEFRAHRAVLAAWSEYFHALFSTRGKVTRLDVGDATGLCKVLEFMYTARLELSAETVGAVKAIASFLQMPDVLSACDIFVENQSTKLDKQDNNGDNNSSCQNDGLGNSHLSRTGVEHV